MQYASNTDIASTYGEMIVYNPNYIVTADAVGDDDSKNWYEISKNPNIDMETIFVKYPHLPWYSQGVSENPNLTLSTILQYPKFSWYFPEISRNQFLHDKSCREYKRKKQLVESYLLTIFSNIIKIPLELTKQIILPYCDITRTA